MKHGIQVLGYEKRKLINRLYEMQEENDFGKAEHTDEDFQAIKRKISQTDDAIKVLSKQRLRNLLPKRVGNNAEK